MHIEKITELEPRALWENFAQICQIPHPSHHEDKIVNFIKKFGEDLKLKTIVDAAGNVIIRKPATAGMEKNKGIILQAHLDMVPQKNSGIKHNFTKDPIRHFVDGAWVKAKDTTLGADNGIGVAAAMAVLQDKNLVHGPLEALFTATEEDGMLGALALKPGLLKGDVLLNLDSEEEGLFCIGCAGGLYTDITFNYSQEKVHANMQAFKVKISGLHGGHSGMDINLGYGNANKILNQALLQASKKHELRLASFNGGGLHNAIPREAVAIVVLPQDKTIKFGKEFKVSKVALPQTTMDKTSQNKLFAAIAKCPNEVLAMRENNIVETSSNLARVHVENGKAEISTLQRSMNEIKKQKAADMVKSVFEKIGAKVKQYGSYPGWEPNMKSKILQICKTIYKAKYNKEPTVMALHVGLECGIFKSKYPNLDMISFGPTIKNAHSPNEKMHIKSVAKFWDFLVGLLGKV